MGLAWLQSTPELPLMISPVLVTTRWLGESEFDVHEVQLKLLVAERLALITPPEMAEPSTGEADQSIHAPLTGICAEEAARRYSDA